MCNEPLTCTFPRGREELINRVQPLTHLRVLWGERSCTGKHLTTGCLSENRKMKPALQHLLVFMVKIFPLWLTVSSHGESPTAVWRRDAYDWLGQHQGLRAGEAEGVSGLRQLAGAAGCVHRWWEGCQAWSSAEVVLRESRTTRPGMSS